MHTRALSVELTVQFSREHTTNAMLPTIEAHAPRLAGWLSAWCARSSRRDVGNPDLYLPNTSIGRHAAPPSYPLFLLLLLTKQTQPCVYSREQLQDSHELCRSAEEGGAPVHPHLFKNALTLVSHFSTQQRHTRTDTLLVLQHRQPCPHNDACKPRSDLVLLFLLFYTKQ